MNYSKINYFDIANGEGIRVSLFVSGCNFHCTDCFNADAQNFSYGSLFTSYQISKILKALEDSNFSGLSLLGGDPLCQAEADISLLIELVDKVKRLGKTVWIWSGYKFEELTGIKKELVKRCDVFVDGRYVNSERDLSLAWRGSKNQRVIDVQKTLKSKKIIPYFSSRENIMKGYQNEI